MHTPNDTETKKAWPKHVVFDRYHRQLCLEIHERELDIGDPAFRVVWRCIGRSGQLCIELKAVDHTSDPDELEPTDPDGEPLHVTCTPDPDNAGLMFMEVTWGGRTGIVSALPYEYEGDLDRDVEVWRVTAVATVVPMVKLLILACKLNLDPTTITYSVYLS